MSKKTAEPEVVLSTDFLKNPNTQSEIVLKVSQADIVDMLVAEYEERLEKELEEAQEKLKVAKEEINNFQETKLNQVAEAYINKTYKKVVDAYKILSKRELKYYFDEIGYNYEELQLHNLRVLFNDGDIQAEFEIKVSGEILANSNKDYKKYLDNLAVWNNLREEVQKAEISLRNVNKMGKRAKAALVKDILKNSDQGQALLKSVASISNGLKLLKS